MTAALPTRSVVLTASDEPILGIKSPGPHQRFRYPLISTVIRSLPRDVSAGHVRVRLRYVGICGTDLHLCSSDPETGYITSSAPADIPSSGRVIGHEGIGVVTSLGEGVTQLEIGDCVALESIVNCGYCDCCRRGQPNQCRNSKLVGAQIDGIFSEMADVPAQLARKLSLGSLSDEMMQAGACIEPASVALRACDQVRVTASERVVIQGGGPIGAMIAMLCRKVLGCSRVEVIEPSSFRRRLASRWADEVYSPSEYIHHNSMTDVLFEASGDLSYTSEIIDRIDVNGRICLLARSGAPLSIRSVDHLISGNIEIKGVRGHLGGVFERVMGLVESNRLPITEMVTGTLDGIDQLDRALRNPLQVLENHCKLLCRLS